MRNRRTPAPAARFARSVRTYLPHFRIWLAFPSIFEVRTCSDVINESGPEANDTVIPRIADAAVPKTIRSALQKRSAELLACGIAVGIVTSIELRARSNVMEFGFEIREILTHLNRGFQDTALGDLFGPVKYGFLDRGLNRETSIPGTAVATGKPTAGLMRMAVRRHDRRRIGASQYPFPCWKNAEHAKFRRYSIVGPAFDLRNRLEIFGRGDEIENPGRRIAAWDEAMRIVEARRDNRRAQFQPPRRASRSRRTR